MRTGALKRVTNDPSENHMPSWSPDDKEIAFSSARDGGRSVWTVNVSDAKDRSLSTADGVATAPSWGGGGKLVYHVLKPRVSQLVLDGNSLTGSENAFPFRVSWASPATFYSV